jgi:hypothetical protein
MMEMFDDAAFDGAMLALEGGRKARVRGGRFAPKVKFMLSTPKMSSESSNSGSTAPGVVEGGRGMGPGGGGKSLQRHRRPRAAHLTAGGGVARVQQ